MGSILVAGSVQTWVVPIVIFALVIGAALVGIRWAESEHLEALGAVPMFSGLSRGQLRSILRSSQKVEFPPSAPLVKQGEQGNACFVLASGEVGVTVDGKEVAKLGAGSYFGEMAVLDGGPRSATVTAASAVSALELSRSALLRIVDHNPDVAEAIASELRRRLDRLGSPQAPRVEGPVTRDELLELSGRLRAIEHPDWATETPPDKHWLGLTGLFARGS